MINLPTYEDVLMAAKRLKGHAKKTPLMRSDKIDALTGRKVWFKPECSQKVGAFKYRGAYNRLSAMNVTDRKRGVVAYSSGNHAQGVSRAAKELSMQATIVMPTDAPAIKVEGVKRDNAKIVFYDRHSESREEIAAKISMQEGRIIVPSYDDPYIIAGQGTVGLEVALEAKELRFKFDGFVTPIGGGGLCAGSSIALKALSPTTKIFCAEPADYNDHQKSLRLGNRVKHGSTSPTLCDALMTPIPGELTFAINIQNLTDAFVASDTACLKAMSIIKRELGLRCEPGGAVAFAALLSGELDVYQDIETICIILSGGNVDADIEALAAATL